MKAHPTLLLALLVLSIGCSAPEIAMDIDGNEYGTIEHSGVTWMAENLKTTKDVNGIPVTFYYPNNDASKTASLGLLYDYKTACKICPSGWRLPTNEEWDKLLAWYESKEASPFKDKHYWEGEANSNETDFGVRPAGTGNNGEHPNLYLQKAYLWSKTANDEFTWAYIFEKGKDNFRSAEQHPTYAMSVRCVKD